MKLHRMLQRRSRGSNPAAKRLSTLATLLSRGAPVMVLSWSAVSAQALPPFAESMSLQGLSQADPSSPDDPYLQSMQRVDPYGMDNTGSAAADVAAELPDLHGGHRKQKMSRTAGGKPSSISRVLNYSVEPEEIVGPGYGQLGSGRDAPVVNTLDPLAFATAVVSAQSSGAGIAPGYDASPFVAGGCLYYVQEIVIQGLASACR